MCEVADSANKKKVNKFYQGDDGNIGLILYSKFPSSAEGLNDISLQMSSFLRILYLLDVPYRIFWFRLTCLKLFSYVSLCIHGE